MRRVHIEFQRVQTWLFAVPRLRAGAPVEVAASVWSGETRVADVKANTEALLILTSDLLVRDELLRWHTALDQPALKALLGDDVHLHKSLQDSVMVHGFNGTSRLWRMPAAAIRRGSVFAISGAGVARLVERAAHGQWLGERAHEGFGRFRIDAALPRINSGVATGTQPKPAADVDEEAIAAKTQPWFTEHRSLAKPGGPSNRKPSLSQWLDLVEELERGDRDALSSRLHPTTAGGRSWKHNDARAVLDKLSRVQASERRLYARYFVRWLRAEMRKERAA